MRSGNNCILSVIGILIISSSLNHADEPTTSPDSIITQPDSTLISTDSSLTPPVIDSLASVEEKPTPMLPAKMIDTLVHYFSRSRHIYNVKYHDLYPRNAAGLLYHEASYYAVTYYETPFRTTVSPFGLSGTQMAIQSGSNLIRPYDRVIPPDGRIDFDDIPTADINSASLIEGPLSAFSSLDGGLAMLYLEPFSIPPHVAKSEFTVERGAYGYAYTRARIGRMLNQNLGVTFSTDYRKGDGLKLDADDDAYYVKTHIMNRIRPTWTLDFYANIYRRKGGFPVLPAESGYNFRRLHRDQQYVLSLAGQKVFGGQLTARFDYRSSRAAYSALLSPIWRTLKPNFGELELSYLHCYDHALYQMSAAVGKEKYDIDQFYYSRDFGYLMVSGIIERMGGTLFFFGRLKKAEQEDISIEGAGGLTKPLIGKLKSILSAGFLTRWPSMTDKFSPSRSGAIGATELLSDYVESGNTELEAERKLTGNAAIILDDGKWNLSLSLNAGMLDGMIYYNRVYDTHSAGEVYPDNDNIQFADLNLGANIDSLGPLYFALSASGRYLDSDRYGKQPPYAPRWQLYGLAGIRYYIAKYRLHIRLFGDITYTETPLSYRLEELETGAIITGGYNLQLKDFTFYYMIHNFLDQGQYQPEGYGYTGWFYSWGFNWKFLD